MKLLPLAFRFAIRYKLSSIIGIMGLSIAFVSTTFIMKWLGAEISYEKWINDYKSIYRIVSWEDNSNISSSTALTKYPLGPALKMHLPEIEYQTRVYVDNYEKTIIEGDNKITRGGFIYSDPSILKIFSFPLVEGSVEIAEDDMNYIILSKESAYTLFGSSSAPGKNIEITGSENTRSYKVAAVVDTKLNTHLKFDYILPIREFDRYYNDQQEWKSSDNYYTYIKTITESDESLLETKINKLYSGFAGSEGKRLRVQKIQNIHLQSNLKNDFQGNQNIRNLILFFIAGILIFVIALANFILLLLAETDHRARYRVVVLTYGNGANSIMKEIFIESAIRILLSIVIALPILSMTSKYIGFEGLAVSDNYWTGDTLAIFGTLLIISYVLCWLVLGFIESSKRNSVYCDTRVSKRREHLSKQPIIMLQFVLSSIIIFCIIIILKQSKYLSKFNTGIITENTIIFSSTKPFGDRYNTIKNRLSSLPEVINITASNILPDKGNEISIKRPQSEEGDEIISSNFIATEMTFPEMFGLNIISGRSFSAEVPTDINSVIINESLAKELGWEDPIGMDIAENMKILGVCKDYNYMSLHNRIAPLIIIPTTEYLSYLYIRLSDNLNIKTINRLCEVLLEISSDFSKDYRLLDEYLNQAYNNENQLAKLFLLISSIAIVISGTGLFAISMFTILKQMKMVSIRMINGASPCRIAGMFTIRFLRWIAFALAVALPIGTIFMTRWLIKYPNRIKITSDIYILTAVTVLFIALMSISYQLWIISNNNYNF